MATPLNYPTLTRTPQNPGGSNYENQGYTPVKYYEARYTATGPNEWIYGPGDGEPWFVTVYFLASGGGSAFIEGSDEAPSDIQKQNSLVVPNPPPPGLPATLIPGTGNIHTYALTDTVTDTTRVMVQGSTAVRINLIGGVADVTATC